jgi:hypothetical protein
MGDAGSRTDTPQPDGGERADDRRSVGAPLGFLTGALMFAGSVLAFLVDLVTGHGVLRSLLLNAAGAAVLVAWAAGDTLSDPESGVATRAGAAGTGVLLYGLYVLLAGLVVAATTVRHGRLDLGLALVGAGAVAVLVGAVVFPRETVLPEETAGRDGDDGGPAG